MNRPLLARGVLALALGAATFHHAGAQQRDRITAAMAQIDPMTASIQSISPADAYAVKIAQGRGVLLIDLRSVAEVAAAGSAHGVDAIVPFGAHADRRGDGAAAAPRAGFAAVLAERVAALGGDHATPLLLLCGDGALAAVAARELTLAGFARVRPIRAGFDGEPGADGRRHGGWKASLPWHALHDAWLPDDYR